MPNLTPTLRSSPQPDQTAPALGDVKICYIGGGSVGWAHSLMNDLALQPGLSGEVRLYDVVSERAELNAKYGQKIFTHPDAQSKWSWRAVDKLSGALRGADVVILSITPGQLEAMAREIEICERYGVFHPVGDTTGPAGLMRGLRAARMYAGFARAIMAHAPSAWVINYSNPLTICTRALHAAAPGIKAFGCCHEVFGAQQLLSSLVEKYLQVSPPQRQQIQCTVTGINHFTWITQASWQGHDLAPLWRRYFSEEDSVQPHYTLEKILANGFFHGAHCVAAALSLRHGALAAAGDRHLAEFVPGFVLDPEDSMRWGVCLTPVREYRIPMFHQNLQSMRSRVAGEEPIQLQPSGEETVPQLQAILTGQALLTNVNLPNQGQIPDLPQGAVVETNAHFSRDQVRPLSAGPLPKTLRPLLYTHVANQEHIVEAALTENEDLALAAIAQDPLNRLPFDQSAALFKDLLAATQPWSYPVDAPA